MCHPERFLQFCVNMSVLGIDEIGKGDTKRPPKQPVSSVTLTLATLPISAIDVKSEFLPTPSSEVGRFG